jgi:hypothetical protein
MAKVRLWINPREDAVYDLPRVCMKCGADATTVKKRQFSWYPQWVWILLFFGIWPFVIVALILTKRQRVELAFCDQHKNHFLVRMLAGLGGFAAILVLGALGFALVTAVAPKQNNEDYFGIVCGAWVVLFVAYLLVVGIYSAMTTIRPTRITERDISLTNVSPEFVRALEEEEGELERDVDRDVRDRWREKRRERLQDDDRIERGDRQPPKRSTDLTGGEAD